MHKNQCRKAESMFKYQKREDSPLSETCPLAEEAEAEVFSVWTCTGCIHVPGEYMEDAGTDLVDPRDGCDRV